MERRSKSSLPRPIRRLSTRSCDVTKPHAKRRRADCPRHAGGAAMATAAEPARPRRRARSRDGRGARGGSRRGDPGWGEAAAAGGRWAPFLHRVRLVGDRGRVGCGPAAAVRASRAAASARACGAGDDVRGGGGAHDRCRRGPVRRLRPAAGGDGNPVRVPRQRVRARARHVAGGSAGRRGRGAADPAGRRGGRRGDGRAVRLATEVVALDEVETAVASALRAATRLDPVTVDALHRATRRRGGDAALAALVRSAAPPGLRDGSCAIGTG